MQNNEQTSGLFLIYFIFSFSLLILYPFWISIPSSKARIAFFGVILFLFVVSNYLLLNKVSLIPAAKSGRDFKQIIKEHKILLILLIIGAIAQIPLMLKPITAYSDEISYISSGMYLERAVNSLAHEYSATLVILVFLFLFIIFRFKSEITAFVKKHFFIIFFLLAVFSILYFYFTNHFFIQYASSYAQQTLEQKALRLLGGLQSMIFALPLILFGYSEFAARLPSLISYLLTSVVTYIFVLDFMKNKKFALYSAFFVLFFPSFFYSGNIAYEAPILALAFISSLYLFIKYQRDKSLSFLFYSFMIATAAVLFEKKGVLIWPILFLIIIAGHLTKKHIINRDSLKSYSIMFFISTVIFLPYFILNYLSFSEGIEEVHQSSLFLFSNLIIPSKMLINAALTPYITTLLGGILFFFGLIYAVYLIKKKKSQLNLALVLSYLVFYLVTIAYRFSGRPRFIIPVIFVFAILIAQFLVFLEDKSKLWKILSVIFSIFLISNTLYLAYHEADNRYLPMDDLFSHIKENTPDNARFMKSMAPSPYNFYILKYNLNFNNFDPTIWQPAENQTLANLYNYMRKTNATYVFFPLPAPSYHIFIFKPNPATWLDLWDPAYNTTIQVINHSLVQDLYNPNSLFIKEAEFHNGANIMFISRINNSAESSQASKAY